MNIICFGDSITQASEFAVTDQWPALLHNKLDEWRADTYHVYNNGIGGNTTALALDRFLEDVIPLLPGMLLVQFDINDSNVREWTRVPRVEIEEFRKNLTEFRRLYTKRNGHCVFIVDHPLGTGSIRQGNRRSLLPRGNPVYTDMVLSN
jgi:lysophospholipase L1-like esterase